MTFNLLEKELKILVISCKDCYYREWRPVGYLVLLIKAAIEFSEMLAGSRSTHCSRPTAFSNRLNIGAASVQLSLLWSSRI